MLLNIEKLNYSYKFFDGSIHRALIEIDFFINRGEIVGLIGPTGSGKTTLIQCMNLLLKPESGKVLFNDINLLDKSTNLKSIRTRIGFLFQYPEYGLFGETVFEDVSFGPRQLGLSESEIESRVKEAIELVGLDFCKIKDLSPFELSYGQKRRIAIASILAMKPELLILDEPTSGLDPQSKNDIMNKIVMLNKTHKVSLIFISHDFDFLSRVSHRIYLLHKGKVLLQGEARKVFYNFNAIFEAGLLPPFIPNIVRNLERKGVKFENRPLTIEEFVASLNLLIKKGAKT